MFLKLNLGKMQFSGQYNLQEASYVWFVSKEALSDFDRRINKNCIKVNKSNIEKYAAQGV